MVQHRTPGSDEFLSTSWDRQGPESRYLIARIAYLKETLSAEKGELDQLCQKKNKLRRDNFNLNHELKRAGDITRLKKEVEAVSNFCDEWEDSIEMIEYEHEKLGVKILNLGSEIRSLKRNKKSGEATRKSSARCQNMLKT